MITLYVLAGFAMLVFAKFLCHFTLRDKPAQLGPSHGNLKATPTELLKPFLLYLQYLWVVAAMQGVDWPATLAVPLQGITWLLASSTPQSLSIECVLPQMAVLPVPVQVFLLSMAMPALIMLVLLLSETFMAYMKGRHHPASRQAIFKAEQHHLVAEGIVVLSLFYPVLLRAVFGLFACTTVDQPMSAPYQVTAVGSFLAGDMSQQCWQGYHWVLGLPVGVPLVLLLCVAVPLAKLVFLVKHRKTLYSDAFRHFSFMFRMYKPSVFFWDVVVLFQTMLLVAISIFGFGLGTYYPCLALTAALALSIVLQACLQPYATVVAGSTALRGATCVFFTSFAALSFLPPGVPYGQAGTNYVYAMVAGGIVLFINVLFIASVAWQLIRLIEWGKLLQVMRRVVAVCTASMRGWKKL